MTKDNNIEVCISPALLTRLKDTAQTENISIDKILIEAIEYREKNREALEKQRRSRNRRVFGMMILDDNNELTPWFSFGLRVALIIASLLLALLVISSLMHMLGLI